jgi:hypothetical protein
MDNVNKTLDFVIKETDTIIGYFEYQDLDSEISVFCMCMLERLNYASKGIRSLLININTDNSVEFNTGILIRSILLDHIIVLNAVALYDQQSAPVKLKQELTDFCLMMLCDTVRHTLEHIDSIKDKLNAEELTKIYAGLYNANYICFEPYNFDGTKPIIRVSQYLSPKKLISRLNNSRNLNNNSGLWELYIIYSKYDHFGFMSYSLGRTDPKVLLGMLNKAVDIFPKMLIFLTMILHTLYSEDNRLNDARLRGASFLDNNILG